MIAAGAAPAAPGALAADSSAATCWPVTPTSSKPVFAPTPSGSTAYSAGSTNITRMRPAASSAAPVATASRFVAAVSPVCVVITLPQHVARQLITDQKEATGHHDGVGGKRVIEEPAMRAPIGERDQHTGE